MLVNATAPELRLMHELLDSRSGIGLMIAGMTHQGWDVQVTAYAARDWRANLYPVAHSVVGGTGWEPQFRSDLSSSPIWWPRSSRR